MNAGEKAKVYVVIPGVPIPAYIGSPRLARPEQASDFEKELIEGDLDAGLTRSSTPGKTPE